MFRSRTIIAVFVVSLFSGCASVVSNPNARYLQIRYPASDKVGMQITFQSAHDCLEGYTNIETRSKDPEALKSVSCSDVSASSLLAYRAMLKDWTGAYLDIEADAMEFCVEVIDALARGYMELASACETKASKP
jgi:hypothetical protein